MTHFPCVKEAIFNRLMKVNAVIKLAESVRINDMSYLLQRRDNLKKLFQDILRFERTINKLDERR